MVVVDAAAAGGGGGWRGEQDQGGGAVAAAGVGSGARVVGEDAFGGEVGDVWREEVLGGEEEVVEFVGFVGLGAVDAGERVLWVLELGDEGFVGLALPGVLGEVRGYLVAVW